MLDWNQWSRQRRAEWRDTARQAGYDVLLHHIDETGVRHLAGIFEPPHAGEGLPIRTVVLP